MAVLAVISLLLMCAGAVAFYVGHFWEKTAELVRFFSNKELNEHLAKKVMLAGGLALFAGIGLMFLVAK
jgi:hypothetical protein